MKKSKLLDGTATPNSVVRSLSRYEKRRLRNAGIPLKEPQGMPVNRREFLGTAAAAGALAALVPKSGQAETRPIEVRTLFFNMSHHPERHSRNFYAVIAGKAYPLERVTPSHPVLLGAQRKNAFL
ncbi:MAG: twin-arginine translocation signal domain-containing protein, partial [Acidobacteriaceae bacterium]|nr:twin-arginine translocation signal domain-containing protein [Acidobacteriaceae bacterium]